MVNRHRGEVEAIFDGELRRLCLTLGALAELEAAFGEEDMVSLAQRFGSGRIAARDAIRVLAAGLRAGGLAVEDAAVGSMQIDGGAVGAIDTVARLLAATFGGADAAAPGPLGND
jgi:Phage tail tube protein, GTA-gp10